MLLTFYIPAIEIFFSVGTNHMYLFLKRLMKNLNSAYYNQLSNKSGNKTRAYLT